MSCLVLLVLAVVNLAAADQSCCDAALSEIIVEGFPEPELNGKYRQTSSTLYVNAADYALIYNRGGKYWGFYKDLSTSLYVAVMTTENGNCDGIVDSGFEYMRMSDRTMVTPTIKCPSEETTAAPTNAAPTTTTNSCPPCRKIEEGPSPVLGLYKNVGSGDDRCSMDGCLYEKNNELYCFETGSYTVENTCSVA